MQIAATAWEAKADRTSSHSTAMTQGCDPWVTFPPSENSAAPNWSNT